MEKKNEKKGKTRFLFFITNGSLKLQNYFHLFTYNKIQLKSTEGKQLYLYST